MAGKITEEVLENYLKCRYKAHLTRSREQGSLSDFDLLGRKSREAIRVPASALLLDRYAPQGVEGRSPLTVDLLKRGLPLLLESTFEDEDLCVRFDGLVRVTGPSQLGDFHYQPVLFHETERPSGKIKNLLGLYGAILTNLQGMPPAWGILIHGQSFVLRRFSLAGGGDQARLKKLVSGNLLHVDETEMNLKGVGKVYVWVFTNLEEVVFMYRPSREGDFLKELLKDFRGVLVSDFYAAYDSLACSQQKCLIHLMRDFNHDLQASPWDEELKALASSFGKLLREVVTTVDRHGLKSRHLRKHRKDVDRFFETLATTEYRSHAAEGYRTRLLKYRDKLFTFLDHDGVPWNNNNAEAAVKRFAEYRHLVDGRMTDVGLKAYLVLLSVSSTCKYKGIGFLKFLLSRQTDIDLFCRGRGRALPAPAIELRPEGFKTSRRKRSQDWDQKDRHWYD